MNYRIWLRVALGYLTFQNLQIGFWALLAPRSFYDGFPGLGRGWIAVDGPYNEHLIRDVGALNLALAVIFVAAAISLDRLMARVAAGAALVWGVPHALYHMLNTDGLSTGDVVVSLSGLVFYAAIPVAVLALAGRTTVPPPA